MNLVEMNTEDLRQLNSQVIAELKRRRTISSMTKKALIHVGQEVGLTGGRHPGRRYRIERIKSTRVSILDLTNNLTYDAPISMLEV